MEQTKRTLEKKLQRVVQTPASFAFFMAIHDFVECIEQSRALSGHLARRTEINKDLKLPLKYAHLKKIHQGINDANAQTTGDLGHDRYMTINDLKRIQNNETSDTNAFWKKRETFRKLTVEVYERLAINLAQSKGK